jgi:hypothetical protein
VKEKEVLAEEDVEDEELQMEVKEEEVEDEKIESDGGGVVWWSGLVEWRSRSQLIVQIKQTMYRCPPIVGW